MENKLNGSVQDKSERLIYLDMMRIFATFTVIILHASAQNWLTVAPNTYDWQIFNIYNSAVRFNVPLFVMISGALFLDSSYKTTIKKLYVKNILRLLTAYILWSFIYAVLTYCYSGFSYSSVDLIKYLTKTTVKSHYHLWFVPMIIGVYMMVPILKPMTEHKDSKKICEYFLILFFIIGILKPSIFEFNFPYKSQFSYIANVISVSTVSGWLGYFVLGYYLRKYTLNTIYKNIFYMLGIIGYLFSAIVNSYISAKTGTAGTFYYFSFSLSSFFITAAWFIFFKYEVSKIKFSEKSIKIINRMSKNMFGLYLIHALVLKLVSDIGLTTLSFNPLLSIPVISLVTFIIGYVLVVLISKIPFINKYLI